LGNSPAFLNNPACALDQANFENFRDFTCILSGINQKTRQSLPVVKILQLYIASYQREYVWKEIWREIVPVVNYTIIDDVKRFVTSNTYDVDTVVQNLLHSQIDN
jgi:hypothetical protein